MKETQKVRNIKYPESGRSMVEMLGVLAIIGILTIGALVGYRQAMDKLHTNEVINEANTRAYTIATQLSMGIPINLSEFAGKSSVSGGNFGDDIQNWGGEFGIPVKDVPEAVCKGLIKVMGKATALRAVTTMDNEKVTLTADNCRESNSLFLVYNKDMAREEGDTSGRLNGCGSIHSSAGGGSNSSSAAPMAPDCSAYPGTSPDNEGGVAGLASDGKTDCKCPEKEVWDGTNEECVNHKLLYVTNGYQTHAYFETNGDECPDGYHWASINEVKDDFNCYYDYAIKGYKCDHFDFCSWLKECTNTGGMNVTPCTPDPYGFVRGFVACISEIGGNTRMSFGRNVLCRRD